ncbi:MAG: hypothetical protein Q9228_007840, partial [Teloschistes exilis]
MKRPQTIRALLNNHTLYNDEVDQPQCPICIFPYRSLPSSELPLNIPGCGHIVGRDCIAVWLRQHNNCPLCRAPVLDRVLPTPSNPRESAYDLDLRIRLTVWDDSPDRHRPELFRRLSPFEPSYWRLCEAIVSLIEELCARSSAAEWDNIISYYDIVEQCTFHLLRYVITHRARYGAMMDELRGLLPDPSVVDEVIANVHNSPSIIPEATPAQIEEIVSRVQGYDARITRAHDTMYERLYPAELYPPPVNLLEAEFIQILAAAQAEVHSSSTVFDSLIAEAHSSIAALHASNAELRSSRFVPQEPLDHAERYSRLEELHLDIAQAHSLLAEGHLSNPELDSSIAELHSSMAAL